jgi:hypothetical protein
MHCDAIELATREVKAREVFVKQIEKTGLPGFESYRQANNHALQGR